MKRSIISLAALVLFSLQVTAGPFKMHDVFKSHMVLQKGDDTTISGTGSPGSEVKVSFNKRTKTVAVDEQASGRHRCPVRSTAVLMN